MRATTDMRTLVALVCVAAGCRLDELRSKRLHKRLAYARQVAMWLLRNVVGLSYPDTALSLARRDHQTAMHACRQVDLDIRTNGPRARLLVDVIERAARG